MEQTLAKLLVSNSKVVQEGTRELKEAFKKPEAIPALCDVIVSSSNPQIRQSAAVVLRRKLGKRKQWNKIEAETRNRIKNGMLQALMNEQEKLVKNAIAQVIGIIGKHEFPDSDWPEILQFIQQLCTSANTFDREMGMYTLSIMTEISQSSYLPHAMTFSILFTNILGSLPELNSNLAYYTIMTMNNLIAVIGGHQQMLNVYRTLLPRILEIINSFSQSDEKRACDLFETVENLIEDAVNVVVPHIKTIVEMCLQMGSNSAMATSVQIKAISVVGWLIRSKGKVIQKNKLVEPIIDVLIHLMSQRPPDGCDNDDSSEYFFGDSDQYTPITVATQTLDLMALHIPAEKVVPYLLTKLGPAIESSDIYHQKAAYLALAVLAEGCSEKIRNKYLEPFLKAVCQALHSPNTVVRNAALFALGQFAEHLQPDISKYASDLLPVLLECLRQLLVQMEERKEAGDGSSGDPPSLDRLFYALETFCENLEEELLPYLPTLMERTIQALDPRGSSLQLKRVALSLLGSASTAVKENMMPYFPKVIEVLNVYINADPNSELHEIQYYAIESLAVIAQYIGPDNFKPLAGESLQFGLKVLTETIDPDVKKSVYSLFAGLAIVMKDEISPALEQIVEHMICSIQSSEGISEVPNSEDVDVYGNLSDDSDGDPIDAEEDIEVASTISEESAQCRYTVENAYNEEKVQACLALREICINTGTAFMPFIDKAFQEIFKLINYPQDDIRRASIEALLQFTIHLNQMNKNHGMDTKGALYKALQMLVPKCSELIRVDEERGVVTCCLETYATLLEEIGSDVLVGAGHREAIMNCVIDVLCMKTMCQDTDLGATLESNDDDEEAEQDEVLLESAGDVIPKFAVAITPDDFALYFPNVLQLMIQRTKKQNSLSQRSFSYGTLAECMKPLGVYVEKFVPQLLQLWLTGARDQADEVRNNAIYGLGEMVLHGKECVLPHYNQILQALSTAVSKESHAGTLDNICGALAKLIVVNPNAIPLEHVFPALLQHLPLRDDFQENEAIINCFLSLYQRGSPVIRENLSQVIKISAQIFAKQQTPNKETKQILLEFLGMINRDFNEEFVNSVTSLGPEMSQLLIK